MEYIRVHYSKILWTLTLVTFILLVLLFSIALSFKVYWILDYIMVLAPTLITITLISGVVEVLRTIVSKRKYEKGGSLSLWYANRKKKLGDDWIVDLAKRIGDLPLNSIKLLSPTANEGYVEKVLFNELVKNKQVIIQCSDISKIQHKEENIDFEGHSKYRYAEQPIEASEAMFLNGQNANIIYDIKGALWYAGKKNNEWRKIIDHYCDITEEQGYLIIDSENITFSKLMLNIFMAKMLFDPIAQENSTYFRARKENIKYLESKYTLVKDHEIKAKNHTLGFKIYKKK